MNKTNKLKLLILIIAAGLCSIEAYGDTEVEQMLQTSVQPAVAISKSTGSIENGTINAETGVHTGLRSVFTLQTNGTDDEYDFIVTSAVQTQAGSVSAYGMDGIILFGNETDLPTESAIEDAKIGGGNNKNVIAYPVTATITTVNAAAGDPMTVEFQQNHGIYGDCYVVKVNNNSEGSLEHLVGTTPVGKTYGIGQDAAGTYKATVTFTAVSK